MLRIRFAPQLFAAIATLLAASMTHQLQAQVDKPIKIRGAGVAPTGLPLPGQPARMHWIVGQATHLGRHSGAGSVQTDSAIPQSNGTITGEFGGGAPFVFVKKNGDQLVCYYGRTDFGASQPGSFIITILGVMPDSSLLVEAHFVAEFVAQPDQSTGKFAGITGSWIMCAQTEPFILGSLDPLNYSWEGEGMLTFQK